MQAHLSNEHTVSAEVPDWSREAKGFFEWNPAKSLLASIRGYQRYQQKSNPFAYLMRSMFLLKHRFWSVITGADIPVNAQIGGGLVLPHPNGVVIHCYAKIGVNCLIFQQVTLGAAGDGLLPQIGGHVDIGAGAKLLGGIRVGDHAKIGANAVVVKDVPAFATAVGVPAKNIVN